MIAETTEITFISALLATCATLSGVIAYLFKLLMKEKDARIQAAINIKDDKDE